MAMHSQPSILLVDDHEIVLQGLQQLLDDDFQIVGTARKGTEVIPLAQELKPDCVLLDISIGGLDGFDIARELKTCLPQIKLIFVTMHSEPTFVREAFHIGVHGYVLKQSATSELIGAIHQVLANRFYVSPYFPREVQEKVQLIAEGIPTHDLSGRLTNQQKNVLKLVAKGYSSQDIAKNLGISPSTVAFHKSNIMEALGIHNAADLTKYAIAQGFASLGEEQEKEENPAGKKEDEEDSGKHNRKVTK
jgi:DNA-binding NarL/FixJ family response regulator